MVNIRGANPQEFHANLLAFDEHVAQLVANVGANLRAVAAATKLGGQQISHDNHQQPQSQQHQHQTQQVPGAPQNAPDWAQGAPDNGYQGGSGGQGQQYGNGPQNGSQGQGYQSPHDSGQQGGYQQGPPQGQQSPQGNGVPTEPPPHIGPAPQCSHGVKRFLAKPYKGGKPGYWMAWACPAQQGDNSQHDLEFIRNS
jgi:hypothetical protein